MEKIKITNPTQFQKLVEELEKNPTLATGFRKGTVVVDFKGQWEGISTILNALGPPIRTGDGWQKIWRDLKFKVKKKMVFNKAECTATGGGAFKQFILSPLEEAVSNLLQFEKQINPEGVFLGAPNLDIEEEDPANSSRQKSTTTISATAPSTTITISSATASAESEER